MKDFFLYQVSAIQTEFFFIIVACKCSELERGSFDFDIQHYKGPVMSLLV